MIPFQGVLTALATPFKQGAIDLVSFRRLVRTQLEQGVNGFVINGTTAESPTLKIEEVRELFQAAREEAGTQTPLLVGTGSNSTAATIEMTTRVAAWKPDGVLVVVPYYNKPPQRGMLAHFKAVADASPVPITLYNVPARTISALDSETICELSRHPRIVAIKEASGDMGLIEKLRAGCAKDFILLSGDDTTCVEFAARGGHGVIAVASHLIGREMGAAIASAQAGDKAVVAQYKEKYAELMRWLYIEANPIPLKMALYQMGLFESPEMRLPLTELDGKFQKDLQACLKSLNKI